MPPTADPIQTIAFVSLGCPKNLVDSEKMLGLLAEDGLIPVADETEADAIVINTCGFLEASKDESIAEIERAAEFKRAGSCKRIVVAGCLVQRHRAKMLDYCPDIDALIGVFDRDRIVDAVRPASQSPQASAALAAGADAPVYSSIAANATLAKRARAIEADGYFESDAARLRLTPRHYAYLRISEGCNQNCSFCTIPSIRGKMRSKPVESILTEARELFADGAFELNLIGQDTTSYGDDIGYGAGLSGMLTELDALAQGIQGGSGGAWLRLMYAYPSCFTDEMIDTLAALANVVKYIDMPLQHINDRVLDSMKRRTSRSLIETLLHKLRDRVPGIALRTTFITGYPGETEDEHRELVEFVSEFGFDHMGVFTYSPEPGTPAGSLHDAQAVDEETAQRRYEELMLAQQQVVFDHNAKLADTESPCDVLIDEPTDSYVQPTAGVTKGGRLYVGRTGRQAPDVDSVTYVMSNADLSPGELVRCVTVEADGYDLIARPVDERSPSLRLPILS